MRYDGIYRIEKCWRKAGQQVKIILLKILNSSFKVNPLAKFFFNYYRDLWSAVISLSVVIMILLRGLREFYNCFTHSTICTSSYVLKLCNCFTCLHFSACSDYQGDKPRPLPNIPELKQATNITERTKNPAWDFDVRNSALLAVLLTFLCF